MKRPLQEIKKIGLDWFNEHDPLNCRTYESLQLFIFSHYLFVDFLSDHIAHDKGSCTFNAKIDLSKRWSNGQVISVDEILSGIRHLMSSKGIHSKILFNNLKDLNFSGDNLKLSLESNSFINLNLFKLPFFAPKRSNLFSKRELTKKTFDYLEFQDISNEQSEDIFQFCRYKDPIENLNLFKSGYLKSPCDTAVPFKSIIQENLPFKVHDTGLFMILRFGKKVVPNLALRKDINSILKELQLPGELNGLRKNMKSLSILLNNELFNKSSPIIDCVANRASKNSLRLIYDDFYPNAIIAGQISNTLYQNRILVDISPQEFNVEVSGYDLKLEIMCASSNSKLLRYFMLSEFETMQFHKAELKKYYELLATFPYLNDEQKDYSFTKMDQLLDSNAIYCPICFIPSVEMGKNPFISGLSARSLEFK